MRWCYITPTNLPDVECSATVALKKKRECYGRKTGNVRYASGSYATAARGGTTQGGVKVILELSNKNSDHGSHIQEVQLRKVSRLKLRVYYT